MNDCECIKYKGAMLSYKKGIIKIIVFFLIVFLCDIPTEAKNYRKDTTEKIEFSKPSWIHWPVLLLSTPTTIGICYRLHGSMDFNPIDVPLYIVTTVITNAFVEWLYRKTELGKIACASEIKDEVDQTHLIKHIIDKEHQDSEIIYDKMFNYYTFNPKDKKQAFNDLALCVEQLQKGIEYVDDLESNKGKMYHKVIKEQIDKLKHIALNVKNNNEFRAQNQTKEDCEIDKLAVEREEKAIKIKILNEELKQKLEKRRN